MNRLFSRRGGSAIEFGIWLPFMALFLGMIMDFGWFAVRYGTAARAARDAARSCASVNHSPTDGLDDIEALLQPVADIVVADVLDGVGSTCDECVDVEVADIELAEDRFLRIARISVEVDYTPLTGFVLGQQPIRQTFAHALDRQPVDPTEVP